MLIGNNKPPLPNHCWLPQGRGGASTLFSPRAHTAQRSLTSRLTKIFYQVTSDHDSLRVMRLSSPARGNTAEGERTEILCHGWQNEPLYYIMHTGRSET